MSNEKLVTRIENIEKTLREILNWLKVANIPQLRDTLIQELDSDEKKRVYELTDGVKSQYEIESLTKISRRMVSYYWQKWYGLGLLVTSDKRKGRMQRLVSLDEVGISVPGRLGRQTELPELEFQPKDLKKILSNLRIFRDTSELAAFAFRIFQQPPTDINHLTREELVDVILETFEASDRMKQSLFMQALERRSLERQGTEFKKFFEAWEKQIGR